MESLLFYLAIILITFLSGIWLTVFVLPEKYQEKNVISSILLGIMWLILVSTWSSYIGLPFKQSAFVIVGISLLLSFTAMIFEYKAGKLKRWIPDKGEFTILSLAFISGTFILFPLIFFNGSFPYGDTFTYISIADYLQDHSYFDAADPNPYYPWLTQMKLYQDGGLRMGAQFLLALMTALLKQEYSLTTMMPTLALAQFCLPLATWFFCKVGLNIANKAALIGTIFVSFHLSVPILNAITGFYPQAIGMVIMLIIFSSILNIEQWNNERLKNIIITSIAIATLVITYSEVFPFIVLSTCLIFFIKLVKNKGNRLSLILNLTAVACITLVLSNIAFINAIKAIKAQMNVVVGWNIDYSLWNYIMIYFSLHQFHLGSHIVNGHPLVYFIVSISVLVAFYIIFRYFIVEKQSSAQRALIFQTCSAFIVLLLYFIYFTVNPWTKQIGHGWNIFKTATYLFYFFPAVVGMAFYQFIKDGKRNVLISSVMIIGYVSLSFVQNYQNSLLFTQQMRQFSGNSSNPTEEYFKLQEVLKDEDKPINIVMPQDLVQHRKMLAYILQKHQIISNWVNDDNYISPYLKAENKSPKLSPDGITLVYNPNAENKIANMEIMRKGIALNFVSGVYELEKNQTDSWHWSSGTATIKAINTLGVAKKIITTFNIGLAANDSSKSIEIWQNQRKIIEIQPNIPNPIELALTIGPGEEDIVFKYQGSPIKFAGDSRELAFMVRNFKYNESNINADNISIDYGPDFHNLENSGNHSWNWSSTQNSSVKILNESNSFKNVELNFEVGSADPKDQTLEVWVNGIKKDDLIIPSGKYKQVLLNAGLEVGENVLEFRYNGSVIKTATDKRDLAFMVRDLKIDSAKESEGK